MNRKISVEGVVLPDKPLTNFELLSVVNKLGIPNFCGVFLRDVLPKKSLKKECGILNLGNLSGNGSHWIAWFNTDATYEISCMRHVLFRCDVRVNSYVSTETHSTHLASQ